MRNPYKKYRKLYCVVLLWSLLLLTISGCGSFQDVVPGENHSETEHDEEENLIVVGFSQLGSESVWRTANSESIQGTLTRENGFFLEFNNARQKQENQIKAIRGFISQRVDYIMFSPATESGWETVLGEARDAGIPVILVDRTASLEDESLYTAWVGSDMVSEGEKAGVWLENYLKAEGREEEEINIVVLQGTVGSSAQLGRTKGFHNIAKEHPNWHILKQEPADFTTAKGKEVMEAFLRTYSDIDVVISQNDDMTFGALQAMEEMGITTGVDGEVILISFDAVREALELVSQGVINVDIECNPEQGEYILEIIRKLEDGEMALPLIRKTRPDVLITDIKMPFMDGLSLSHIVGQEFPEMKIIIISGYDDFEYARQAIKEGVEQYLLKPVTRRTLQKALTEVKEKIESEQEQKNYLNKYQDDMHEYEQFILRTFFEKVFAGQLSVQEIYEEAQKHSLDINAPYYNLILIDVQEKANKQQAGEACQKCYEELMRFLMRFSNYYLVFRWNINIYGIMIKGEKENIAERTDKCLEGIEQICVQYEEETDWYAAAGSPVERFSQLSDCYRKLNHIFNYRFFEPANHILSERLAAGLISEGGHGALEVVDMNKTNPELIKSFLAKGQKEEAGEFVSNFLLGMDQVLKSRIFWDYTLLNVRFAVLSYMEEIGVTQQAFLQSVRSEDVRKMEISLENMRHYIEEMLTQAIAFRDRENESQSKKALKKSLEYIEENYMRESLSLNEIAAAQEVSPNYFSAMFSQEMQMTFVEYVTQKRMEKAKSLLRETEMRSNEIALAVGYKNPHYFSFVFKKTQGCTPREYRALGEI